MKLLLGSNNHHKLIELGAILVNTDFELLLPQDVLSTPLDVVESGSTLEENAYLKARAFFEATGIATIADDTGLFISALNGNPGVYTARWAGENATYAENVAKTLMMMASVSIENRIAEFRTSICYVDNLRTSFAEGVCRGAIATEERGVNGFGYDPIFIPEGFDRTFSELDDDVKNSLSHRARALDDLRSLLTSYEL